MAITSAIEEDPMDYGPEGQDEVFIPRSQAKAAFRTHYLLVATRLVFIFSHGALMITASLTLRQGWKDREDNSWWIVFTPVWMGNALCCMLIIYSWFASCPYIQLCLEEHQARLGYSNPSILTDILPEIVLAILSLIVIFLTLIGEVMLCRYLTNVSRPETGRTNDASIVPSAIVLLLVALCGACHGVCIRTNSDYFNSVGFGALATFITAICVPGGVAGSCSWVILIPSPIAVLGLLVAAIRAGRSSCGDTLRREERLLCTIEQVLLSLVLVAFVVLIVLLASSSDPYASACTATLVGGGICLIAALRAVMARLECRQPSARDQPISQVNSYAEPTIEEASE